MPEEQQRIKPGPKKRFGPRDEIHLKFPPETLEWILEHNSGYQVYFDKLVKDDMDRQKTQETR